MTSNPILVGLVGEEAASRFLGSRLKIGVAVDTSLLVCGDGGKDFVVFGKRIEVKSGKRDDRGLLRHVKGNGKLLRWESDYYVFVQVEPPFTGPRLLGFIAKKDARLLGVRKKAERGDHHNIHIDCKLLSPMCRLVDLLRNARDVECL